MLSIFRDITPNVNCKYFSSVFVVGFENSRNSIWKLKLYRKALRSICMQIRLCNVHEKSEYMQFWRDVKMSMLNASSILCWICMEQYQTVGSNSFCLWFCFLSSFEIRKWAIIPGNYCLCSNVPTFYDSHKSVDLWWRKKTHLLI